jgi:hypothetical protein
MGEDLAKQLLGTRTLRIAKELIRRSPSMICPSAMKLTGSAT